MRQSALEIHALWSAPSYRCSRPPRLRASLGFIYSLRAFRQAWVHNDEAKRRSFAAHGPWRPILTACWLHSGLPKRLGAALGDVLAPFWCPFRAPASHFGAILEPFWVHFGTPGAILSPFTPLLWLQEHIWAADPILGPILEPFKDQHWTNLDVIWELC